ncbi:MAG TPA: HrpE/YscL family type III secretion apparatus protein [Rhabdochlamydiaceae bacterium]|jgi:type III secretion protein L|nr:HrpE/YscL family type III secretion apparatus protein [Rhabdochlamydiaceae bacterium]
MSKFFSLIEDGEVHPASNKKIIPQEEFGTLMEASEVLEKARQNAEEYRAQTEAECQELREIAKIEGYQEGLEQLNANIIGLDQEKKRLRHEMNKLILPLALKAAKKIVAKELETKPETIVDIVLQALSPVLQNHQITIWVNKADKDILETEKNRLKEKLEQVQSLSIKERDDVTQGGCIIETESGIINANIDNQWRAIESAFDKYLKA